MLDVKERLVEISQISEVIRRQELRERPAREDILENRHFIDSTRSHKAVGDALRRDGEKKEEQRQPLSGGARQHLLLGKGEALSTA